MKPEIALRIWGEWLEGGKPRGFGGCGGDGPETPVDHAYLTYLHVEKFFDLCPFECRAMFVWVYAKGREPEDFVWHRPPAEKAVLIEQHRWRPFAHLRNDRMLKRIYLAAFEQFSEWLAKNVAPDKSVWNGFVGDDIIPTETEARFRHEKAFPK